MMTGLAVGGGTSRQKIHCQSIKHPATTPPGQLQLRRDQHESNATIARIDSSWLA